MCLFDALNRTVYKVLVNTVLAPLRNQAFRDTRNAKISDTEREALASGDVGFEGEFLNGVPDWEKYVRIDEQFVRPAEVDLLIGDPGGTFKRVALDDHTHQAPAITGQAAPRQTESAVERAPAAAHTRTVVKDFHRLRSYVESIL